MNLPMNMSAVEILGYAASIIVFISLTMKSLVKLRLINAAGSLLFVVFALRTSSFPTAVLNVGIVIIDVYYFVRTIKIKNNFDIVRVQKENEIVLHFYKIHKKEIVALFGEQAFAQSEYTAVFFRNDDIAGLLAYSPVSTETAEILIDFAVPAYRDCAIGRHFFVNDVGFWKQQGYEYLIIKTPDKTHIPYIKRLGFTCRNRSIWEKKI